MHLQTDSKMVTWNYEVIHYVPNFVALGDYDRIVVDYLETCEPRQILLPETIDDPQFFLDELSRWDATDAVSFSNFAKAEQE
jgi:hypothetical protein